MTEIQKVVAVRIQGHVQGVGFRAFVQREAESNNVEGWVRNRRNGDVEALFAGPASSVDTLVAACRRGPEQSHVTDVLVFDPNEGDRALVAGGFRTVPTI